MVVWIKNVNLSISLSLTLMRLFGFWPPKSMAGNQLVLYYCYGFLWIMFLLGTFIISQLVELYLVWGNLPLVTAVSFVLFTNAAQAIKIAVLIHRREIVQGLIDDADAALLAADTEAANAIVYSCNRETFVQQLTYCCVTCATLTGWASSAETSQLPIMAWYPYDVTKSPSYELSYVHQIGALCVMACLNIAKDSLVTALIAQCCCRLRLLGESLRTLCRGMEITEHRLTAEQEATVRERLRVCVLQHNSTLQAAQKLQDCFSIPVFMQFNVSLVIICVTAFQLVSVTGNRVRFLAMGSYLVDMMLQVFLYCYQGNQLTVESVEAAEAAYQCPWYAMSTPLRRSVLIVMTRTRRATKITAAGFTTLSLACFTAIIKTSYSMFTLLQRLENKG